MDFQRKVLPIVGYKGYLAAVTLQRLILGLKMIPGNMHLTMEELTDIVKAMSSDDQLKTLTQAAMLIDLKNEELDAMVCFCTDKNGIPYTAENRGNLKPNEYWEIIVTVCFHLVTYMRVDLITEEEKKN